MEFIHIIDESIADKISQLNELEINYIKTFDSVNSGYNLQHGGLNGLHSEETKLKIGLKNKGNKSRTGYNNSEESKIRMSKIQMGHKVSEKTRKAVAEANKKREFSENTRRKMSESRKNRTIPYSQILKMKQKSMKPINQYDMDFNLIKEWDSAASIFRESGIRPQRIRMCCAGQISSFKQFIWK